MSSANAIGYLATSSDVLYKFFSEEYQNAPLIKSMIDLEMEFDFDKKYWLLNSNVNYRKVSEGTYGFIDASPEEKGTYKENSFKTRVFKLYCLGQKKLLQFVKEEGIEQDE